MLLKFSTALLTKEAAQKAIPPSTKIHGHPPRGDHNKLRDKVLQALGAVDMPDSDHGFIGELAKPAEFRWITGEDEDYDVPYKPLLYDDTINHDIMSPVKVKMAEAEHLQKLTPWHVRKGTLLGGGDQLRKVLDRNSTNGLRKSHWL